MPIAYFHLFEYYLLNILAAKVFGRVETGFLVKNESKRVDNLPVSTKW